ncbi:hypothetical protein D3C75_688610 [compost metagenome]
MPQPDKVGAHFLHQLHFGADHLIGHCRPYPGMVLMALGAVQEKPLPVQQERSLLHKLKMADPEALQHLRLSGFPGQNHLAGIQQRLIGAPQHRGLHSEGGDLHSPIQRRSALLLKPADLRTRRIADNSCQPYLTGCSCRIVQSCPHRNLSAEAGLPLLPKPSLLRLHRHMHPLQRYCRHIHQMHMPVNAPVQVEIADIRGHCLQIPGIVRQHRQRH